jgi:ectoine hydroxylase-related dioxygenase (phytanoyl-CoA dioxygenase family)
MRNCSFHESRKDIRPLLNKDSPWAGSFFPAQTRRAYALLNVSDVYTSKIVMHPTYQAVAAKFLTLKHWFWEGQNKQWAVSKPQLSNTIVFSIAPGATNQPLHRDDSIHQWVPKAVDVYPLDKQRDASVGFFVAAKKATKENGATRFIPGSHLWGHDTPPNEDLCQYAEMERGDAFLMLASCFHGGSANHTEDKERLIFSSFMTRGVLRQEENQYLAVDKARMKKHPVEVQKIAGYSLSEPFLGWVESTDPRVVLDPSVAGEFDILYAFEFG